MNQHISFSNYSDDKDFKNLFTSNEIFDEEISQTNKILFRIPNDFSQIDNLILTYDGQNLFDSSTSHFGTIFDLENILQTIENEYGKNFLIIGITSNEKRHIQYNPYPKENEINYAETHIKNVVSNFLPSVLNYLNINLDNTNQSLVNSTPIDDITYIVTVIDENNCLNTEEITLTVYNEAKLAIPKAFTPNGDGKNDFIRIQIAAVTKV